MDPYRQQLPQPIMVVAKQFNLKRWWLNRSRRLALWWRGTWKYRFFRCSTCNQRLPRIYGGDDLSGLEEVVMHNARHAGEERAREEFAKAKVAR